MAGGSAARSQPSSPSKAVANGASPLPPGSPSGRPHMTTNGSAAPPARREPSIPGGGRPPARNYDGAPPPPAAAPPPTDGGKQRHRRSEEVDRSAGPPGASPPDNDAAYCAELARRSAARAALHLGIEGMEGEALDVLGSLLLGYMDTVASTVSSNVESSGRSSAHSNAYDALNAVEICTAPAAAQLGSAPSSTSTAASPTEPFRDHTRLREAQERGWEGLASFLFGPDWFSIPVEGEGAAAAAAADAAKESSLSSALKESLLGNKNVQSNGKAGASGPKKSPGGKTMLPARPSSAGTPTAAPKGGKGKQLINMKGNEKAVSFSRQLSIGGDGKNPSIPSDGGGPSNDAAPAGRWDAPYPDAVPPFPLVTNTEDVANPHRLPGGSKISLSLHDLATEMEACREVAVVTKRPRRGSGAGDPDGRTTVAAKVARMKEEVDEKAMRSALRIPDDVYNTMDIVWGSIQEKNDPSANKKRDVGGGKKSAVGSKTLDRGDTARAAAASSRVKFDASSKPPPSQNASASEPRAVGAPDPALAPPYVPNFLPPFPTDQYSEMARDRLSSSVAASAIMGDVVSRVHHREKRKASSSALANPDEGERAAISDRDAVRRSVIGLGRAAGASYWGSRWLEEESNEDAKSKSNKSTTGGFLWDVTVAPSRAAKKPDDANEPQAPSNKLEVAPLGRASGSRLSKILEGSMNVS